MLLNLQARSTLRLGLGALMLTGWLTACGGGDSAAMVGGPVSDTATATATVETVTISGRVTFDRVNHQAGSAALDYQQIQAVPARGVQVKLLDAAGQTLASDTTDNFGAYNLPAPVDTEVRVRVEARMQQTDAPGWHFSVHDNTQGNALYVLDGQLRDTGDADSARDLHAASGWTGTGYMDVRAAAPFAILDTVYKAVQKVVAVDPDVQLPEMQIFWSGNNRAVEGEVSDGDIGTSFYTPGSGDIYLLGDAGDDTDEYDRGVISHEFAHYLEDQLSRTESIGGAHSGASQLDMRVAFSEGWGNAFAGIATGDPMYRDSFGSQQGSGMRFSVAENTTGNHGWYSESSVHTILYKLFDQGTGGFAPIYRALISDAFIGFDGAASIYPFISVLRASGEVDGQLVDSLLAEEQISGEDGFGTNEVNSGGSTISLPLYHHLTVGGAAGVCSDNRRGEYNGLDVRRFLRFQIVSDGGYVIAAEPVSGLSGNPDFVLWRRGEKLRVAESASEDGREQATVDLAAGFYWLEVYEFANTDDDIFTGGPSCFTVSLSNVP